MSNIRIEKDLDPTFARASTAEKNDGTIVLSGVPRYENVVEPIIVNNPAKWDRGAYTRSTAVARNILTVNQSNAETDITGFSAAGTAVRTISAEWAWQGTSSLKVQNANSTSNFAGLSVNYENERTYLASAYAYNPGSGTINVSISIVSPTALTSTFTIEPSGVVRVYMSRVSSASAAPGSLVRFFEATGQTFHLDGLMLEDITDKPNQIKPAPWIVGGGYLVTDISNPDFSRATAAFNHGVNIGTNTPRFELDGLLFERSITNLSLRSQEFDNASWTKVFCSVSGNVITAPDGTLTADKIIEDAATDAHAVNQNQSLSINVAYVTSIYAKAGERNWLRLSNGTAANGSYANFDLSNGTIGSTNNAVNKGIIDVGDGWYRCWYMFRASATAVGGQRFSLMDSDSIASVNTGVLYTGDGVGGLYLWGAQFEAWDHVTSYIPTTSATVVRNADYVRIPNYGMINKSSGAAIARAYIGTEKTGLAGGLGSGTYTLFQIHSDTILTTAPGGSQFRIEYVAVSPSGPMRGVTFNAAGTTVNVGSTGVITPGWYNFALRWENDLAELWINGSMIGSQFSVPASGFNEFTAITLGGRGNLATLSNAWNAPISHFNLYDTAPSTGSMASLTASGAIPTGGVYSMDFTGSSIKYDTDSIYTSEWFNSGVSGCVYSASGSVVEPANTTVTREYRTANADNQSDATVWSNVIGTGKYIQYRDIFGRNISASLDNVAYSLGTTITPNDYGKSIALENATTNLFSAPLIPSTETLTVTPGSNYSLRFNGTDLSSGAVLIQHVNVETTTADFGTGTLSNVQASGNVLTLATAKADPTFSRATVATLPNELTEVTSGVVRYASGAINDGAINLMPRSQEFTNTTAWPLNSGILTPNAIKAPDGTMTATKLVPTAGATSAYLRKSALLTPGQTYTLSVYAKAAELVDFCIWLENGDRVIFNLSSGVITQSDNATGSITPVGDNWYRCSLSRASIPEDEFRIWLASGVLYNSMPAGDYTNKGVYLWGFQAEIGTVPTTYIPTTISAASRSSLSGDRAVMIEEATTNEVLMSQEFTNAYWVMNQGSVSSGFVAPDGTSTAFKMFENAVNTRHYLYSPGDFTAGSERTYSIYAKAAEVTGIQLTTSNGSIQEFTNFNLTSGIVASSGTLVSRAYIELANNGWYRCSMTIASNTGTRMVVRTVNAANADSYAGNPASGVLIWGAQAEQKAYATSYIPTTTASVTRNAENVTIPSGAMPAASGTIIARVFIPSEIAGASAPSRNATIFDCGTTSTRNRLTFFRDSSPNEWNCAIYNDVSATNTSKVSAASATGIVVDGWNTFLVRWSASNLNVFCNGKPFTTPATGAINIPLVSTTMQIGRNIANSAHINNLMSAFVVYNEYMSDSEAAYYSQTGVMIPLDHRTTYSLRFTDNLNHGEGGYRITPVKALDQIGTITGSSVAWSANGGFGTPEDVIWTNGTNVTITGNSIQKTGGAQSTYDAGAMGSKTFGRGSNFYASFVINTVTGSQIRQFGLSNDYTLNPITSDYIFGINPAGTASVYENNTSTPLATVAISIGSVLSVAVSNNVVRYYHNGVMIYTSLVEPNWPLSVVSTIYNSSAIVSGAIIGDFAGLSIDTSIDNGSTWYPVIQSGAINGLSSEVSAIGKNLLIRQKLTTPRSAAAPQLTDITTQIAQKQTKNIHEVIKPIYTKLEFSPTSVTKWQLQNVIINNSFQTDGTVRNSETLSIPSSGIINPVSGSVVCRIYHDPATNNSSFSKTGYIFSCGTATDMISMLVVNGVLRASKYGGGSNGYGSKSLSTYGEGWHTYGMTWNSSGVVSLWIDGDKISSDTTGTPTGFTTPIYIGSSYVNTLKYDGKFASIDLFGETLTDEEMAIYTAGSGTSIPVTQKHTYQLKFENNLEYGMSGTYVSRVLDSQIPSAKWATYRKQDVVPAGASITYLFSASDNIAGPFNTYSTDITSITGRYIKVKIICTSSDVNNFNPQILDNTVRVYPKSV